MVWAFFIGFDRKTRLCDRETGLYDSRLGLYDRKTGLYDSKTLSCDNKTRSYDSKKHAHTTVCKKIIEIGRAYTRGFALIICLALYKVVNENNKMEDHA